MQAIFGATVRTDQLLRVRLSDRDRITQDEVAAECAPPAKRDSLGARHAVIDLDVSGSVQGLGRNQYHRSNPDSACLGDLHRHRHR